MSFEFKMKAVNNSEKTQDQIDKEIIICIFKEKTNQEIAQRTGYSMAYIKKRLNYLFRIYGVKSKVGLVREIFKDNSNILCIMVDE